jgi:hypothetical protein
MSSRAILLAQQHAWAVARKLEPNGKGYLAEYAHNLYLPLSSRAVQAFMRGGGSELVGKNGDRPKMSALHSSAALAVNVFDYWSDRDAGPLVNALGLEGRAEPIEFEAQFPTGLDGTPPNLDVAIRRDSGFVTGIESKFTEWLASKSPNKELFKEKYFKGKQAPISLWASVGLMKCQALAEAMQARAVHFRHLDAAQLLKHALGLGTQHRGQFSLYYLFYDLPGDKSAMHRREVQAFAAAVGTELGFKWGTYQDLFARLSRVVAQKHPSYLEYLRYRYFS